MYKNELNKVKSKLGHLKAIHSVKKRSTIYKVCLVAHYVKHMLLRFYSLNENITSNCKRIKNQLGPK